MKTVYIFCLCLFAAEAVLSDQQSRAEVVLDLYNEKLNFFDSFLSPNGIDGLVQSEENISYETVKMLRSAWIPYTSLHGEIISWCTEVINTVVIKGQSSNRLNDDGVFASNVILQLNHMKRYFDSIAQENNVEDYKAVITITDGVAKYEVINGYTTNYIEKLLQPLITNSKTDGSGTVHITLTPGSQKVNHAKSVIAEALSLIGNTTSHTFNRQDIVTKCRPILDKLASSRTSPQQYTPPPQTITPSERDVLRLNEGNYFRSGECVAILSKSTMKRLKQLYRMDQTVANFFSTISKSDYSRQCIELTKTFINKSSLSWIYEVENMRESQFLKIILYINSSSSPKVTIVN